GIGQLNLNSIVNTVTNYTVNAGFISMFNSNRLGSAAGATNFFTLDGGGLGINVTSIDYGPSHGITVGPNGAFFGGAFATEVMTISAPIAGTGAVALTTSGPFSGSSFGLGL